MALCFPPAFPGNSCAAELPATAPTYGLSFYDVYAGLPQNGAPVLIQTRDGYVWVGTESGLARFNGVRFVNFRTGNTPELPSNHIRHLFEDRAGWLWIGTQNGLCRHRDGKFERVGLIGSPVADITEDNAGHLWIATQDQGLIEYREGRFISHADMVGMPPDKDLRFLFMDSTDRLWVGVRNRGAVHIQNDMVKPFAAGPFQFQDIVRVVESPRGTWWIATDNDGILRLRDGQLRRYGPEQGLGGEVLRNIFADQRGQIWAILQKSLLVLPGPDAESFVHVPTPGVEYTRELIQDHEGSYWIGTASDGVVRMRPSGFRMATAEDGLLGGNSRTVAIDRHGVTWAGLPTSGIARIAPDGQTTVLDTGTGTAGEVWSVLTAADGRVWIGTRSQLIAWRDGRQEIFPQFSRVRALFEDRAGTLWIGSETEGVTRYKDGTFTSLVDALRARQATTTALHPIAMAFAEGPDGSLYIGLRENGGLAILQAGRITIHQRLETTEIRAIYPDRDGHLWIGTKGRGLVLFSGGQWFNPEVLSERFNDHVSAIAEDGQGRFWLGTQKGIVWTRKDQLLAIARGERAEGTFRLALASDGVRPAIVGAGSFPNAAQAPDGTLRFGTKRGLVIVDPSKITINDQPPPVQIERVVVDNKSVIPAGGVRLPAGSRALTIDYAALSFVSPSQVFFRFRLEGRDPEWTEAGTRRTAFYTDLSPGSYRFRVIACNDDGMWNETGASVAIVQLPFFYQTPWFYGVVALGLLGAGIGILRWRTAALKKRNVELERGIAQRTIDLAKSYEAVRASEYFYHTLVESLPQIIVRKDAAGRFTYANPAFAELIGRPLDQVVGHLESELYPPEKAGRFRADDLRAMETRQTLEYESVAERAGRPRRYLHVKKVPLYDQTGQPLGVQILFWDMTTFREVEEKLKQAQRELIEISRLAAFAEMATGILHNLGNALNSVNLTTNSAIERIRNSKVASVGKAAQLLSENAGRLPEFLSSDPRGRKLPGYLAQLGSHLTTERDEVLRELQALQESVDQIKDLVASQQRHARVAGVTEIMSAAELVEFALRINESSLAIHGVTVTREFSPAPMVKVERQKVLQIIGNLITNAQDAMSASGRSDKRVTISVRRSGAGHAQIIVADNGSGIAPEDLPRVFAFGFTTKPTGHGFGLHSSALTAREIGGSLHAFSDGPGKGATFILELPTAE